MTSISISEIENLFDLVIKKLRIDKLDKIEINLDEYWIITSDEWNNFETEPISALGSFKEDIEGLKKTLADQQIFTYSDFDRLATLLRSISEIAAPISQKST